MILRNRFVKVFRGTRRKRGWRTLSWIWVEWLDGDKITIRC